MSPNLSIFIILCSFLTARAQDRAPHGIAHENPTAISPSAYLFFHPKSEDTATEKTPFPIAAQFAASAAELQNKAAATTSPGGRKNMGAGAVAGIVVGVACAVLLAMGALCVVTKTRKAKSNIVTSSTGSVQLADV